MLLRGQSYGSRSHFTKAQKLTQIEAKSGQFLVFFLRDSMRSDLFLSDHRMNLDFHKFWVRRPALFGCCLVLATTLFTAVGGDQLSVIKSQDQILRARSLLRKDRCTIHKALLFSTGNLRSLTNN